MDYEMLTAYIFSENIGDQSLKLNLQKYRITSVILQNMKLFTN